MKLIQLSRHLASQNVDHSPSKAQNSKTYSGDDALYVGKHEAPTVLYPRAQQVIVKNTSNNLPNTHNVKRDPGLIGAISHNVHLTSRSDDEHLVTLRETCCTFDACWLHISCHAVGLLVCLFENFHQTFTIFRCFCTQGAEVSFFPVIEENAAEKAPF